MKFLGHTLSTDGLRFDSDRVSGDYNFSAPTNITETRRFQEMVNYMGEFIPNLAEKTKPLRYLVSQKNAFVWESEQKRAFISIKEVLYSTQREK